MRYAAPMNPRIQKPTASAQDGWERIVDPGRARALGLDPIPRSPSNEPHVRVRSVWLEAPLDDDWCIEHFDVQDAGISCRRIAVRHLNKVTV